MQNFIDQNKVADLKRLKELYPNETITEDTKYSREAIPSCTVKGKNLHTFIIKYKLIK